MFKQGSRGRGTRTNVIFPSSKTVRRTVTTVLKLIDLPDLIELPTPDPVQFFVFFRLQHSFKEGFLAQPSLRDPLFSTPVEYSGTRGQTAKRASKWGRLGSQIPDFYENRFFCSV
jgi:hypothetical protein